MTELFFLRTSTFLPTVLSGSVLWSIWTIYPLKCSAFRNCTFKNSTFKKKHYLWVISRNQICDVRSVSRHLYKHRKNSNWENVQLDSARPFLFAEQNWSTKVFVFSMLCLILSPNIVILLLGWDKLGITSYLLVVCYMGHSSPVEGMTTFLTNRLGDVFFYFLLFC